MSKIGKIPVKLPSGVKVEVKDRYITVEGENGKLTQMYDPTMVTIQVSDGEVVVTRQAEEREYKARQGLYRSLLANMVQGVSTLWQKNLVIKGSGFRVRSEGKELVLELGYAMPVRFKLMDGIEADVPNPNEIIIKGIDKQLVGQTAAMIRALRKPEPYKGTGIIYKNEEIFRKAGKMGAHGG
ncbi:50S ribosomal protein L6 [Candidatus Acetothermia bacterium]|jgi:large subunit ribosomal protein L6|nr:50S ribosomal protein L6 [Candidatus Acetothermia bacterium]MCI2426402.1 50S ribosomal protein L6 [Candidatus Acetothermia bacterium]MCI2427596.1 50S ribosomal protein L6 [Candidatus Acetothermia bacterium]MCI2428208.1 50S ribosomal protein L6 [Candidatus Acetothermia bacterium]